MPSCCDPNGLARVFDARRAARDARDYRRKGLDQDARRIVDFLKARGVAGGRARTALARPDVPGRALVGPCRCPVTERGSGDLSKSVPRLLSRAVGHSQDRSRRGAQARADAAGSVLAAARIGAPVTTVRSETDAHRVVRITLDRPDRKNAFDAELVAELTAATGKIDPAARAVVLQSEGDTFCAGADIDWSRGMADYTLEENLADSRALARMFRAIHDLPMPVVARVQGAAIGGGAGPVAGARIAGASRPAALRVSASPGPL